MDRNRSSIGFRIASVARRRTAQDHAVGLRRRARRGVDGPGLGRHAGRHARCGDTFGVPAAGRNRFARLGSQRRGAAGPGGHPAAPRRCRSPAAPGWCGSGTTRPTRALGWAADTPCGRRRADAAGRRPPGTGLVAGRRQGDADPGPPACPGPGPVRQADRRRFRRSGTDWPRHWWPSKAPRRR